MSLTPISRVQQGIIVATGTFQTMTRQTMPISYCTPLPDNYKQSDSGIEVPPGTYLYIPKIRVEPINEWSWQGRGETIAEMGAAKVVRFTKPGGWFQLRMLPSEAPTTAGFIIIPL